MDIDTMKEQASRYKPTINIQQAPPLGGPLLFLATAWVSLFLVAWRLMTAPRQWWPAVLTSGSTLATVHIFTLGFLTMTMFGVLYQWVPVVFDRTPVSLKAMILQWSGFSTGLILFVIGFAGNQGQWLAIGGSLLASSIILFTVLMVKRVIYSSRKVDVLTISLGIALAAINATWILGLTMALGFAGIIPYANVVAEHLNTAWVGWVVMLVLTVQIKLLPMFAMARIDKLPNLPITLGISGLAVQYLANSWPVLEPFVALLWVAAGLSVVWQIWHLWRHSQSPRHDGIFAGVLLGWILWIAGAAWLLIKPEDSIFLVALGAMTFIFSYQSRIIPFLVALFIAKKLPGPVFKAFFMAQSFNSPMLPIFSAIWSLALSVLILIGVNEQYPTFIRLAGLLLLIWPLVHISIMGRRIVQAKNSRPQAKENFGSRS